MHSIAIIMRTTGTYWELIVLTFLIVYTDHPLFAFDVGVFAFHTMFACFLVAILGSLLVPVMLF